MTNTCYLWSARQSEPGHTDTRYEVTATKTPPADTQHVRANNGLIYQDSLYDAWELVGAVRGKAYTTAQGESCCEHETLGRIDPADLYLTGAYAHE